jgi:hypothetical protein
VPKIETVERIAERHVPQIQTVEKVVEVPHIQGFEIIPVKNPNRGR